MNRRPLTDEEKRLWEFVTRTARPLHPEEDAQMWKYEEAEKKDKAITPRISTSPHLPLPTNIPDAPLARGAYAGIDRNTAERFRKGKYPIDATLDLHGMTRDRAYEALGAFIKSQHERQNRCLLVITGKGGKDTPGVLRELLPVWLADFRLKSMLLAFDMAQPKHGGSGAYYILLRRKRQ